VGDFEECVSLGHVPKIIIAISAFPGPGILSIDSSSLWDSQHLREALRHLQPCRYRKLLSPGVLTIGGIHEVDLGRCVLL
jgi:hypothetical protein